MSDDEIKVRNPDKVRERIRDYYREADLWLPENSSWRVFRARKIQPDGRVKFVRIKDRIEHESDLRKHMLSLTPLDVYFTVSCFLNPTKTGGKTYAQEHDGRRHIDKNHFLFSDVVVDMDHMNKEMVAQCYDYLEKKHSDLDIIFSGGGYHINLWKWYRNRDISNPIEREKHFQEKIQELAQDLKAKGFEFDYIKQENGKLNSPTTDTRRVRKLPRTVTKYGNKSEIVPRNKLSEFEPEQVMKPADTFNTKWNFNEYKQEVKNSGSTDKRVLITNTK